MEPAGSPLCPGCVTVADRNCRFDRLTAKRFGQFEGIILFYNTISRFDSDDHILPADDIRKDTHWKPEALDPKPKEFLNLDRKILVRGRDLIQRADETLVLSQRIFHAAAFGQVSDDGDRTRKFFIDIARRTCHKCIHFPAIFGLQATFIRGDFTHFPLGMCPCQFGMGF